MARFELATSSSRTKRAAWLRYIPIFLRRNYIFLRYKKLFFKILKGEGRKWEKPTPGNWEIRFVFCYGGKMNLKSHIEAETYNIVFAYEKFRCMPLNGSRISLNIRNSV